MYLTKQKDPQRLWNTHPNMDKYITKFYNSLENLDLTTTDIVVFHEELM